MPKKTTNFSQSFVTILGVRVDSTPRQLLLKLIESNLQKKIHFDIVTPNPEIILQAQSDPELAHSLASAKISIPDGFGLKLAAPNLKTIKGREFMLDLFKLANTHKLKIFLLADKESIEKSLNKIKKEYPDINVEGESGPMLDKEANPVSQVDINLQSEIVNQINKFQPDLLFVAFGAPKQEKWLIKNHPNLDVIGGMVIGGALDYYAGIVKPVPKVFEILNLEWLWRLIIDPKRFKRIFNALVIFPVKLFVSWTL